MRFSHATGTRTQLAESLGFTFRFRTAAALRGYIPNTRKVNAYLFWLSKDILPSYAWAFPCPDGTLNIGMIYFEFNKPQKAFTRRSRPSCKKPRVRSSMVPTFSGGPKGFSSEPG